MRPDKPGNKVSIIVTEIMSLAKPKCVPFAQLGVVTPSPFCDIMKNRGKIKAMFFEKSLHDLTTLWQFVIMFRYIKAAKIPDNKKQVGVHRIRVE
jgi:hypothetical protein